MHNAFHLITFYMEVFLCKLTACVTIHNGEQLSNSDLGHSWSPQFKTKLIMMCCLTGIFV